MTTRELYASATGVTNIISVDLVESYKSFSSTCTVSCESTSLEIGDEITVDIGYTDSHGQVFTGYVKKIETSKPDETITLTCFDKLVLASDYFLAADDPDNPFTRTNIDATYLVRDLLLEAGITTFSASPSNFIFTEPSFNLCSVADAINQVANIIAYHIWCDTTGTVHFADRRPYVMSGDTPTHTYTTGNNGNILTIDYARSDDDLRNKVTVYGKTPIVATASAASPYLPTGFYKTAVIASPLITTQTMAQLSAQYNLELYNKLTRSVNAEILGDHTVHVNDIVTVTETYTGVSGDWFVYGTSHSFNQSGYTVRLTLRA